MSEHPTMAAPASTTHAAGAAPGTSSTKARGVAAIVGFLFFVELSSGFLQGYYTPLFAELIGHWGVSDSGITWFVTVQTLAAGVCVPVLAKLGDIFGHRRMLRISVIAVAVGSALVALSPSYELALVGRALVGPLAVWLPLEIAIVHSRLTQTTARRAIGMLVASITLGAVLGSIASGIFGGMFSMTVVLLIPVGVLVLCVLAVFVAVPESTERANPKIDTLGFIGLAAVMLLIMGGLQAAGNGGFGTTSLLMLGGAVVVFIAWVWWEKRAAVPAIDISLVTKPQLWPAYFIAFVVGMLLLGGQTVLMTFFGADPEKVGYGFNFAPGKLAILTILGVLPATIISFFIANLAKKIGLLGVLAAGLAFCLVGSVLLAAFNGSLPLMYVAIISNGLGSGLLLAGLPSLIAEESPADSTGIATGIYNSLKTLGAAISSAAFGMVLALFTLENTGASSHAGYVTVWTIGAVASVLALLSLLSIRKARPQTTVVSLP